MPWNTRLLPASFRGIPFQVESAAAEGGRRIALHEYPLRDTPYAEDLGRRARRWRIDGVVIGPNYDLALAPLIAALERNGPGLLSHPYHGLRQVVVLGYTVTHSTREGGMARLDLDFGEAGSNTLPGAIADTLAGMVAAVADAISGILGLASVGVAAAGLFGTTADAAAGLLRDAIATYQGLAGGLPIASAQERATLSASLALASASAATTAASPDALASAMVTPATEIAAALPDAGAWAGYEAFAPLTTWGSDLPAVIGDTPARAYEAANQATLIGAVRDAAVAEGCRLALRAVATADDSDAIAALEAGIPTTRQDIEGLRDDLAALIDARATAASDAAQPRTLPARQNQTDIERQAEILGESARVAACDTLYRRWLALRQAVTADLSARALQAPRVEQVIPAQTEPALVLAYRVHGDAARAGEIVRRNNVRHPGFVPGGLPVDVVR